MSLPDQAAVIAAIPPALMFRRVQQAVVNKDGEFVRWKTKRVKADSVWAVIALADGAVEWIGANDMCEHLPNPVQVEDPGPTVACLVKIHPWPSDCRVKYGDFDPESRHCSRVSRAQYEAWRDAGILVSPQQ